MKPEWNFSKSLGTLTTWVGRISCMFSRTVEKDSARLTGAPIWNMRYRDTVLPREMAPGKESRASSRWSMMGWEA
jgi:hypothetical protein